MSALDQQYLRRRERQDEIARIKYGDEFGTPDQPLPDCPGCDERELWAYRYGDRVIVRCYACKFFYDFEQRAQQRGKGA